VSAGQKSPLYSAVEAIRAPSGRLSKISEFERSCASSARWESISAKALIGECGIVEIIGLMGQYTGLTMLFVIDRYPTSGSVG
jgi:hypothetical protein